MVALHGGSCGRDRLAESTFAIPDPLTPSEAPVSTGPPRERGAAAFHKACKKQKAELKAIGEKLGTLGVTSLVNKPRGVVASQSPENPTVPCLRVS